MMSLGSLLAPAVLAAVLLTGDLAPAHSLESVAFPSADGASIDARFYKPAGSGPFPAIIALHGCDGPNDARGELTARGRDWRDRWLGQGFAVLLPNSFDSRGVHSVCRQSERRILPSRERADDVAAARRFLQSRPDIRADRIALVGWSHGGSTVLWSLANLRRPDDGKPDFWRAVAFYPGCAAPLRADLAVRLPLLILIGEADDWTPTEPCRAYVARRQRAELIVYPGAHHGFDAPNTPVRELNGLAFTVRGDGRAFVGTDTAARADAIRRLGAFLNH